MIYYSLMPRIRNNFMGRVLCTFSQVDLDKGQAHAIRKRTERPVYFDQGGVLTKKFGIEQVPACVSQEGFDSR